MSSSYLGAAREAMTETPHVLTETPTAPSDVLSDLLGKMHLTGTVLFRAEFREPWAVTTPDSCQLAGVLPVRTEQIIPFHVVASGGCSVRLSNGTSAWLREGDAVLLPNGDAHRLAGKESVDAVPVGQLLPQPPWTDMFVVEHGGAGSATSIVCGFVQCDELLFHPIAKSLPPLIHVGPDATPGDHWLGSTIRHTAKEASSRSPGSRSMLPRLTELMFVEILRKHMRGLSEKEVGWFAAFHDPVAGAALKRMHASPRETWSVESLAREIGVSRSVLGERFKHFLDQPPMQYLARWRLQLAAQELKTTDRPLKLIAEESGYESEAAFGRAFKRHFGQSPGDWRKRQRSA